MLFIASYKLLNGFTLLNPDLFSISSATNNGFHCHPEHNWNLHSHRWLPNAHCRIRPLIQMLSPIWWDEVEIHSPNECKNWFENISLCRLHNNKSNIPIIVARIVNNVLTIENGKSIEMWTVLCVIVRTASIKM